MRSLSTTRARETPASYCLLALVACCVPAASGRPQPWTESAPRRRPLQSDGEAQLGQEDMRGIVESLVPMEPEQWNETVHVYTTQELREVFCRADGALVDVLDPSRCQSPSMEPVSINVILGADISLLGTHLPVLNGAVKIGGACHEDEERNGKPCIIYAVDENCCGCRSVFMGGSTEICSFCRVGDMKNTQPIQIGAGSRLWMEFVDVCGGRAESDGGNVSLLPADRTVWESKDSEGLSFLSARNVTFMKGLSETRGGAISIKAGGLVELSAVTFLENFALVTALEDPSHDIMVKGYGGLIMEDMPGPVVYKLEDAFGAGGGPFAQGQLYERLPPPLPVLPGEGTAGGSYAGGATAGGNNGNGSSGGFKLDFGTTIGIVGACVAVAVILGGFVVCCLCNFGRRPVLAGTAPAPAAKVAPQKKMGADPTTGLTSRMEFQERAGSDWRIQGNPSAFKGSSAVAMQREAMEIEARVKKFKEDQAEQRLSNMNLQGFLATGSGDMAIPSGQGMMPDSEFTPKITKQYSLSRQPSSRVRAAVPSTRRLAAWHVPDEDEDDSLHAQLAHLPLPNPETGQIETESASKKEMGTHVLNSLKNLPSVANKIRLKQEESQRRLDGHLDQSPLAKSSSRRNLRSHRHLDTVSHVSMAAEVAGSAAVRGKLAATNKSYRRLRADEVEAPGTTRITRSTRKLDAMEGQQVLTPVERFDDPNAR